MKEQRGQYRSITRAIADGADFQRLSTVARLAFLMLKLRFDVSGIEVKYSAEIIGALVPQTGATHEQVTEALAELVSAGWLRIEANLVWIVDQLRFDPHMSPANPMHRKAIQTHIDSLPHRPVVEEWRAHYPEWCQPVTQQDIALAHAPKKRVGGRQPDRVSDRESDRVSDRVSPSQELNEDKEPDRNKEQVPPADTAPVLGKIDGGISATEQRKTWLAPYGDVWREHMGGAMPNGIAAKVFKELEAKHEREQILANLRRYCAAHQGARSTYAALPKFAQTFAQWGEAAAERNVAGRKLTIGEQVFLRAGGGQETAVKSPYAAAQDEKYRNLLAEAFRG